MINRFSGKYDFLSNFFISPIVYERETYLALENAFQAAKTLDHDKRDAFASVTPGRAKRMGRTIELRRDWDDIRLDIMRELVWIKFKDPTLRKALLDTGTEELIEGNNWGDHFYGFCDGYGENWLGRILMEVRDQIKRNLDQYPWYV